MAKATSCREAIKEWESKTGQIAAESNEIKLVCMQPPIEFFDDSLNYLVECERLSLASNKIEKIQSLSKLRNLKVLSLGRNNIKRLNNLDEVGKTLEELWISHN